MERTDHGRRRDQADDHRQADRDRRDGLRGRRVLRAVDRQQRDDRRPVEDRWWHHRSGRSGRVRRHSRADDEQRTGPRLLRRLRLRRHCHTRRRHTPQRVNNTPSRVSACSIEDRILGIGATPNATARTGSNTVWLMATLALKSAAGSAPTAPAAPTNVDRRPAGDQTANVTWSAPQRWRQHRSPATR